MTKREYYCLEEGCMGTFASAQSLSNHNKKKHPGLVLKRGGARANAGRKAVTKVKRQVGRPRKVELKKLVVKKKLVVRKKIKVKKAPQP
jgi:hypothetical protein